jgi:hypothetical protein
METRRTNAEKIWQELQRRRSAAEGKKQKKVGPPSRKKRESGKLPKRLDALVELMTEEDTVNEPETTSTSSTATSSIAESQKKGEGIFGAVKEFYKKADSLAASQALLLNKELEDRGVVEKITDETGLKVIGRDEAKKLQREKEEQ